MLTDEYDQTNTRRELQQQSKLELTARLQEITRGDARVAAFARARA
jgi:hypothetical protein